MRDRTKLVGYYLLIRSRTAFGFSCD